MVGMNGAFVFSGTPSDVEKASKTTAEQLRFPQVGINYTGTKGKRNEEGLDHV